MSNPLNKKLTFRVWEWFLIFFFASMIGDCTYEQIVKPVALSLF
jgi:hypothetical protein